MSLIRMPNLAAVADLAVPAARAQSRARDGTGPHGAKGAWIAGFLGRPPSR